MRPMSELPLHAGECNQVEISSGQPVQISSGQPVPFTNASLQLVEGLAGLEGLAGRASARARWNGYQVAREARGA
jgi:hypothetical protein